MLALQRSAGNTSTVALMRRARSVIDEPPMMLTLPEVVEGAAVSSYSLQYDSRRTLVGLNIVRPTDADSPRLAKASIDGPPNVKATFVVRKLTPLGWIPVLTIAMDNCMVSSFTMGGQYEQVSLTFTRAELDYEGVSG